MHLCPVTQFALDALSHILFGLYEKGNNDDDNEYQ